MRSWVVVTSRAGTQNKGLWKIAGHTLVEWVLENTKAYAPWTVVTTDQPEVMHLTNSRGIQTVVRPAHLCAGTGHMQVNAVLHAMTHVGAGNDDIIHLVQPTSPFVREWHIAELDKQLREKQFREKGYSSACTIAKIPHNYHYLNQRRLNVLDECVEFVHPREGPMPKQDKPEVYKFGTVVSVRHSALIDHRWFFAPPCGYQEISLLSAIDIDSTYDLCSAEALLSQWLIHNPFYWSAV